jgi:hypothetical protein
MFNRTAFVSAILVTLIWAGFWAYFILAATWGEPGSLGQKLLVTLIGLGIVFGSSFAPLANPRLGGGIQVTIGLVLCVANFTFFHNPLPTRMLLLLTMAVPPIVSGALFLSSWRQHGQAT